jgi:hypothetical protein
MPFGPAKSRVGLPSAKRRCCSRLKANALRPKPKRPTSLRYREPGSEHDRSGSQYTKRERGRDHRHALASTSAPTSAALRDCAATMPPLWSCMWCLGCRAHRLRENCRFRSMYPQRRSASNVGARQAGRSPMPLKTTPDWKQPRMKRTRPQLSQIDWQRLQNVALCCCRSGTTGRLACVPVSQAIGVV